MEFSNEIQNNLLEVATRQFLKYVKVNTSSILGSNTFPSSKGQIQLGKILVSELEELDLEVIHDENGYIYAEIPATKGLEEAKKIGLIAHLDTSPAVSGIAVEPRIIKNYDGSDITFKNDTEISLTIKESPPLKDYIGLDLITSQGDTLLGADDKAGVAEIMAACTAWQKFPELKHGPIIVCFFPDEEIGKGTEKISLDRLPKICYTFDGSEMGEIEYECFDAWKTTIKVIGLNVHPGYSKDLMINAIDIASRFLSELPLEETPRNTKDREGFYHLGSLNGNEEQANASLIIRDFEVKNNERRMEYMRYLKSKYEKQYLGLKIDLQFEHQYENMYIYLEKEQEIIDKAKKAIELAGLEVRVHAIRGGTDGAQLSKKGIPTPNIFAGGLLFHSRKEYIPTLALQKAAEVIIHLAELWTK